MIIFCDKPLFMCVRTHPCAISFKCRESQTFVWPWTSNSSKNYIFSARGSAENSEVGASSERFCQCQISRCDKIASLSRATRWDLLMQISHTPIHYESCSLWHPNIWCVMMNYRWPRVRNLEARLESRNSKTPPRSERAAQFKLLIH